MQMQMHMGMGVVVMGVRRVGRRVPSPEVTVAIERKDSGFSEIGGGVDGKIVEVGMGMVGGESMLGMHHHHLSRDDNDGDVVMVMDGDMDMEGEWEL